MYINTIKARPEKPIILISIIDDISNINGAIYCSFPLFLFFFRENIGSSDTIRYENSITNKNVIVYVDNSDNLK